MKLYLVFSALLVYSSFGKNALKPAKNFQQCILANIANDFCDTITGAFWSTKTSTCISVDASLSWDDAFANCAALAPAGVRGRLAHIFSEAVASLSIFNGTEGWLGAKTVVSDSSDLTDFHWFENSTTLAWTMGYLPEIYDFGKKNISKP